MDDNNEGSVKAIGICANSSPNIVLALFSEDGPNESSFFQTPALIALNKESGEALLGAEEVNDCLASKQNEFHFIEDVFQFLGLRFRDVPSGTKKQAWIRADADDAIRIGGAYHPEQLAAMLLKRALALVEERVGFERLFNVPVAVAVPGNALASYRRAVQNACRMAGIRDVRLISVGAAVAVDHYLADNSRQQRLLCVLASNNKKVGGAAYFQHKLADGCIQEVSPPVDIGASPISSMDIVRIADSVEEQQRDIATFLEKNPQFGTNSQPCIDQRFSSGEAAIAYGAAIWRANLTTDGSIRVEELVHNKFLYAVEGRESHKIGFDVNKRAVLENLRAKRTLLILEEQQTYTFGTSYMGYKPVVGEYRPTTTSVRVHIDVNGILKLEHPVDGSELVMSDNGWLMHKNKVEHFAAEAWQEKSAIMVQIRESQRRQSQDNNHNNNNMMMEMNDAEGGGGGGQAVQQPQQQQLQHNNQQLGGAAINEAMAVSLLGALIVGIYVGSTWLSVFGGSGP